MITGSLALLALQLKCQRTRIRRTAPQQFALVLLVSLLVGLLLNTALFAPLFESYSVAQSAAILSRFAEVIGAATAVYAFSFSASFPVQKQDLAHRVTAQALGLNRAIHTGLAAGAATAVALLIVGCGTDVGWVWWVTVVTVEIPMGVVIGLATAMLTERVARMCTQRQAVLAIARLLTMSAGIIVVTTLVAQNWLAPWLFLSGSAAVALSVLAGFPPIRPEWLVPNGRARSSPSRIGRRLLTLSRVGLLLLWRDYLAIRTSLGMVALIAAVGILVRAEWNATITDLYLAGWPLLLAEIAGASVIPALMKQTPVGGGLFGHRWRPAQLAIRGLPMAVAAALMISTIGMLLTSITTGIVPTPTEILTVSVMGAMAAIAAVMMGTLWRVAPDAADVPVPLSVIYLTITALLVSLFNTPPGTLTALAVVVLASASLLAINRSLRQHAPFTR